LTEVYAERGQDIPENLRRESTVDLDPFDEAILHDYLAVRTERPVSAMGGLLPIPWSAICRYAEHQGYHGAELDWFISIIQRIDGEQLTDAREESEKKSREKRSHPKHHGNHR
jgi:hypothetical protein